MSVNKLNEVLEVKTINVNFHTLLNQSFYTVLTFNGEIDSQLKYNLQIQAVNKEMAEELIYRDIDYHFSTNSNELRKELTAIYNSYPNQSLFLDITIASNNFSQNLMSFNSKSLEAFENLSSKIINFIFEPKLN